MNKQAMNITNIAIYFVTGGVFTTLIVLLEQSGFRTLSAFFVLMPTFTLVAYIFIGQTQGSIAVSENAKWVLFGSLVAWVPYMLTVAYLSPKIGSHNAIIAGLAVFFVLALTYVLVVHHFGWFQQS